MINATIFIATVPSLFNKTAQKAIPRIPVDNAEKPDRRLVVEEIYVLKDIQSEKRSNLNLEANGSCMKVEASQTGLLIYESPIMNAHRLRE